MRDNVSRLGQVINALALPVNKNNITGVSVAVAGYNAISLYINAGTWTDGTHTFTIQEASDVSGSPGAWTNVNNIDLITWQATSVTNLTATKVAGGAQPSAISSAATAINQRIGYIGGKDWVRVNVAVTGSPATGAAYDAYWIEGEPRLMPASV